MLNLLKAYNETQALEASVDIINNLDSKKIRRGTLHHILYSKGLMPQPGKDNFAFHTFIDKMKREGKMSTSKTKRATYLTLI